MLVELLMSTSAGDDVSVMSSESSAGVCVEAVGVHREASRLVSLTVALLPASPERIESAGEVGEAAALVAKSALVAGK